MAIELVNGRSGEPHVSGEDVGRLLRGIAGEGDHWVGAEPGLTVVGNEVTFGPCDLLLRGMHATLDGTDSWTVESAGAGVDRVDVLGLRYERAADGTETLSPAIVKGREGSLEPPTVPDGSRAQGSQSFTVPIARARVHGAGVPAVEVVLSQLPLLRAETLWEGRATEGSIVTPPLDGARFYDVEYEAPSSSDHRVYTTRFDPIGTGAAFSIFAMAFSGSTMYLSASTVRTSWLQSGTTWSISNQGQAVLADGRPVTANAEPSARLTITKIIGWR